MYLSVRFKPVLLLDRFVNLFAQVVEDFARAAGNVRVFQMTWTSEINLVFAFDLAGTEGQQNYTISKSHCLANVMRDKDDGAPGFRPDALQFVVKQITSLGIECREGFVHQ